MASQSGEQFWTDAMASGGCDYSQNPLLLFDLKCFHHCCQGFVPGVS
jgi:hypothetical protein